MFKRLQHFIRKLPPFEWLDANREQIRLIVSFIIPTLSFAISIICFTLGYINQSQIITTFGGIFLAAVPLYLYFANIKQKHYLATIAIDYVEKNPDKIDDILGLLINKKTSNFIVDGHPIDRLFNVVRKQIGQNDVEMQRRVTEALPALYLISEKRYWQIVRTMVIFYDTAKWRSDIRRRVLESLNYIVNIGQLKDEIFEYLSYRIDDELHTQSAIMEVLSNILKKHENNKKYVSKVNKSYNLLLGRENEDEIKEIWTTLEYIRNNQISLVQQKLCEYANFSNEEKLMLQIFAARNFRQLCSNETCYSLGCCRGNYQLSIKYANKFLTPNKHKNVQRPIAKEDSLECFCSILKRNKASTEIKNIFWTLFKSNDYIIRITSFDKIKKIYDINKSFAIEIINYIVDNEKELNNGKQNMLLNRAKRLKAEYERN